MKALKTKCSVAGCGKRAHGKGMCQSHYNQQYRKDPSRPKCKFARCEKPVHAHGLCNHHYTKRWFKKRTLDPARPKCKVAGCEKHVHLKGLCGTHHSQQYRNHPSRPKCKVRGCEKPMSSKGMCVNHYAIQKFRDPSRPKCKVAGCENTVYTRGICNKHRHQHKTDIVRSGLFKILGGKKCVQCGYSNELALAFDHIYNDGHLDRKSKNYSMERYVNNPSLARDRLQVLCYNCNTIKEIGRARNKK